jgi:alkaline phosphatase
MTIRHLLSTLLLAATSMALQGQPATGSAIFIHPDGTGLGHWNAARHYLVGPDGMLNWDRMERLAAYRPHQKNWLSTTSHAGATVHAYGRKVHHDTYGLELGEQVVSLSGKPITIMEEAMAAGIRVGIVNSGHIGEPGTGVFLARSERRDDITGIAAQVIESGAELIFCGGERYMLPEGETGRHGQTGKRRDGRNLLKEAADRGYTVIHTREELLNLKPDTRRVLGVFAAVDTYNAERSDVLQKLGLPTYNPGQPTFDEMVRVALAILGSDPARPFFLVAEEEGTDNFSNKVNAQGMLDAMERADRAIGEALRFMQSQPRRPLTLLVAADSDAGSPTLWAPREVAADFQLPPRSSTGAQLDGPDGTGGRPFVTPPDAFGNRHVFGIAWPDSGDMPGSAVSRAHGFRSGLLPTALDNTGVYKFLYEGLFGTRPWELDAPAQGGADGSDDQPASAMSSSG